MLTQSRLKEVLQFDAATGLFTWRVSTGPCARIGAVAGSKTADGYISVGVDGRGYLAHRLAWLYVYGEFPAVNCQNRRRAHANSKTGVLGVSPSGSKYVARIQLNGMQRHLGSFATAALAHAAYLQAKRALHKGFCEI